MVLAMTVQPRTRLYCPHRPTSHLVLRVSTRRRVDTDSHRPALPARCSPVGRRRPGPSVGGARRRCHRSRRRDPSDAAWCLAGGVRRGDPAPARRTGPPRRARRAARDPTVAARPHQPGGCTSRLLRDDRSHRTRGPGRLARAAHVRHRASPTPRRGIVDLRRRVRHVPRPRCDGSRRARRSAHPTASTRTRTSSPRHRRWRSSPASFVTPDAQVCRRATSSCCGAWPRWSRRAWWPASAT